MAPREAAGISSFLFTRFVPFSLRTAFRGSSARVLPDDYGWVVLNNEHEGVRAREVKIAGSYFSPF